MRIEYQLKYRDLVLFSVIHQFLSLSIQLMHVGCAVLVYFVMSDVVTPGISLAVAILSFGAFWAAQVLYLAFYLCFGKNRALFTAHLVEIQEEAFYVETRFGRSYYFWSGVAKVISCPGYIAVYLNANAAHIVPDRAFSTPDQRLSFLSSLQAKAVAC